MKNTTGFYIKGNHPSNKLKLQFILSIFIIGIFILFGFASIDEEDPTNRILDNCEFLQPPVAVVQKCQFQFYDDYLHPIKDLVLNFIIQEYEKVDDSGICHLVFKTSYYKLLTFDINGSAYFFLSKSYISNDDEIEIYFKPILPGYEEIPHTVSLGISDDGINYSTILRKIERNP